jgi:hypothetical protein
MAPSTLITRVLRPSLRLIQLLVQALRSHLDQRRRHNGRHAAEQDQATAKAVKGLLRRGEEVWADWNLLSVFAQQ